MRLVRTVSVAAGACALTAVAAASAVTASPAATTGPVAPVAGPPVAGPPVTGAPAAGTRPLSVTSGGPGVAHAGHRSSAPPTTAFCEQNYHVACYQPSQLQRAYGLPALYQSGVQGQSTTIAIVDSFGSPTIGHDLATFDRQTGLSAPPSLKVIAPAGKVPAYNPADAEMVGWAAETTLDVEYAHAVAPQASILL